MRRTARILAATVALAGCAPQAALVGTEGPEITSAAYPSLAPLEEIMAASPPLPESDPAAPVAAQGAALRARAADLRSLTP